MTGPRVDIAALRGAVAVAVEARSLRAVADDIGMSWSGLRTFLDGSVPAQKTIAKLVEWRRHQASGGQGLDRADMLSAAEVMADYIQSARSPEGRIRRLGASLEALAERLDDATARALRSRGDL